MKLNTKLFALATGITTTIFSLVCAILFWLAPQISLTIFNSLFHGIDLTKIAKNDLTFGSVILGLIISFIIGYLFGLLLTIFYNKFHKE